MTASPAFTAPAGGFTFVAPTQDACDGDACLVPSDGVVPGVVEPALGPALVDRTPDQPE